MWNKWERDDWDLGDTPPESRDTGEGSWSSWLQIQVPHSVTGALMKPPDYTPMVWYSAIWSLPEGEFDIGWLAIELPPWIYKHPKGLDIIFYDWFQRDRAIERHLENNRTLDLADVFPSCEEWMDIFGELPWTPNEQSAVFQEMLGLQSCGFFDWGTRRHQGWGQLVYVWARTIENVDGKQKCNAVRVTPGGMEEAYIHYYHGLRLVLRTINH